MRGGDNGRGDGRGGRGGRDGHGGLGVFALLGGGSAALEIGGPVLIDVDVFCRGW